MWNSFNLIISLLLTKTEHRIEHLNIFFSENDTLLLKAYSSSTCVCVCVCTRFWCCCYDNSSRGAVIWRTSEKNRRSQTERKTTRKNCVWKSLNSYLPCMCQMALCTLLLHNQNSESHFPAHANIHAHSSQLNAVNVKHLQTKLFSQGLTQKHLAPTD